jgi:hypothetical protein
MAGADRGRKQSDRLLGELLTYLESLRGSQGHVAGTKLLGLFAIQLRPLSLIARPERRSWGA